MKNEKVIAVRRLSAFAADWLVLALWGVVVFGAVMIATGGNPARPANPWIAQGIGFMTMTLPFTLYFALCESSEARATLGKRLLGLVVSRETGGRLPLGTAFLRNAIKFLPWECGHTVALQAAFSGDGGFAAWVWGFFAVALIGPAWWLVSLFATGRPPYDRWAHSRVSCIADHEKVPEAAPTHPTPRAS